MRHYGVLILCVGALFSGGCATMIDGTTQELSFQSNPENVTVTYLHRVRDSNTEDGWKDDTRILGVTPLTLQMDREAGHSSVVFSKEGYKPVTMKLVSQTNANMWGNILLGGLPGTITDSLTGAIYEYSTSQFFVALNPATLNAVETAGMQDERLKAKEFLVRRFRYVLTDLSHDGGGEELTAAFQLLRVSSDEEAEARRKMKALSEVYPDAPITSSIST